MLYSCTFVFVYLRICIFCIEKLREYEKSAKKLKNIKKVIKQLNHFFLRFRKKLLDDSVLDNLKFVLDSSIWTKVKVNIVCEINFSEF